MADCGLRGRTIRLILPLRSSPVSQEGLEGHLVNHLISSLETIRVGFVSFNPEIGAL